MLQCNKVLQQPFHPVMENPCPFLTAEQVIAASKANVETLFGPDEQSLRRRRKADRPEPAGRQRPSLLAESADATKAALSVKDAQELLSLQAGLLQPAAEKPPPTAATCTTSPPPPTPKWARSPRKPPPTRRRSSWPWSTPPSRTPPGRYRERRRAGEVGRRRRQQRLRIGCKAAKRRLPTSPKPTSGRDHHRRQAVPHQAAGKTKRAA